MDYDFKTAKLFAEERNSGFWQVKNRCFFDKTECLKYATKLKTQTVSFHFYDEIYGSYNWKSEPNETLEDLYKERAIQLREKHKYLVLMISGGADSTNMLQSFLKNNIKVDEIVCVFPIQAIDKLKHNFDPKNKHPENYMFEYTHAALPIIQSVSNYHPEIKITILDYIDDIIDIVKTNNFYKMAQSGLMMSISTGYQYTAFKHIISLDKDAAIIFAIDKPRIKYNRETKKFESTFIDFSTMYGHFNYNVFNGNQPKIEYFYYTPDLPKIVIKQSIIIKNYLESISLMEDTHCKLYKEMVMDRGFLRLDINVHHDLIKKLIYKNWDTEIYQAKKVTNIFYGEISSWFFAKDLTSNKLKDFHEKQLNELLAGINPNFITYTPEGKPGALKFLASKFYEL